jgi:hypothetical protein
MRRSGDGGRRKLYISNPGEVPIGAENAPAPEGSLWPSGLVSKALIKP